MRHTTSFWLRSQRDLKLLREEPAGNTAGCARMIATKSYSYFSLSCCCLQMRRYPLNPCLRPFSCLITYQIPYALDNQ
jgi:hypothetical protein